MNLINKLTLKRTLAAAACVAAMSFTTANACTGVLNNTNNAVNTHNGFYYSFWKQTNNSRVDITCGEPGYYKTDWSGVFNWVGGMGWNPGGARIVNYHGTFNSGRQRQSSNSYLALYGWTRVPTEVEYYVVESYGNYNPANCGGGGGVAGGGGSGDGPKGSVVIDGVGYDLTQCTRTNQPSISGTSTFKQFFSVRQNPLPWGEVQGSIDVGAHFQAWANAGMQLGNDHFYMVLASEGYDGGNNSSGNSELWITEGPGGGGGTPPPPSCGSVGDIPVCCHISADDNGDGMGMQNGDVCTVTQDTEGWHPPNPADVLAAINVGGTGPAEQIGNIYYAPNTYVTGGTPNSTTSAVSGSNSDVHKSEIYGDFSVSVPMSNQRVSVELDFVELYWTEPGQRSFNVSIEGQNVLTNVDIFDEVGANAVWKQTFDVNVTGGQLDIDITTNSDNGTLSAILVREGGVTNPDPTPNPPSSSGNSSSSPNPTPNPSSTPSNGGGQPPATGGGSAGHWLLMMLLAGGMTLRRRRA